jgi:NAD(P)-dependent dehydrogenase (short-subunit alcohol dehydrogenase family)
MKAEARSSALLGLHRFGAVDQERFAAISGDRNPLHLDPVVARRTQAGERVVHGMHAVLWALEALARAGFLAARPAALRVRFRKFMPLDRDVGLRVMRRNGPVLHAAVVAEGVTTVGIQVDYGVPFSTGAPLFAQEIPVPDSPLAWSLEELPGRSGLIPVRPTPALGAAFPRLAILIGPSRLAALTRLSALVGMVCPGLYSIFNEMDIRITEDTGSQVLTFHVDEVDERFRLARMHVLGSGIEGAVTATVRHPPIDQPTLGDLRSRVQPLEFGEAAALVIGGSRGLGAVTARLIAAGGGRVILTYAQGAQDAREVASEFDPAACQVLHYDAREPAAQQISGLKWRVNQLYYFATPPIFRQKRPHYAGDLFDEFCKIYLDGFADVCTTLAAQTGAELTAFYPSSVAVTDRPTGITEYAMAKAAGEVLCKDLARTVRGLRIVINRLPRILTDQTATGAATGADPVAVMLPILRNMRTRCED